MASAAEAETAGIFGNAQMAITIRRALEQLGHPQPPTPIKTDNSTAHSFVHNNIKQRRSKTWDMRWNWLRDRKTQQEIQPYWDKGSNNDGDYFTKHHPPEYHKIQRQKYILKNHIITQQLSSTQWAQTIMKRITPETLIRARVCSSLVPS